MAKNKIAKGSLIYASGFSLIELLTYLAILSILLLVAFPKLGSLMAKSNLENRTNELMLSIKAAKIAALNSHRPVIICRASSNYLSCKGNKGKGKIDWSGGWLVFNDSSGDKTYQQSEKLIKVSQFNKNQCDISWNRGDYLSFHKFGMLKGSRAGSFVIHCGKLETKLIINWIGRVRRKN